MHEPADEQVGGDTVSELGEYLVTDAPGDAGLGELTATVAFQSGAAVAQEGGAQTQLEFTLFGVGQRCRDETDETGASTNDTEWLHRGLPSRKVASLLKLVRCAK